MTTTTRILVSVRNVDEALLAAGGGADFIDLKEPRAGALGGLPITTITQVVNALRQAGSRLPISATIGDWPMQPNQPFAPLLAQVRAVAECGVSYVKVGIERDLRAGELLRQLAACGHPVVPVFIADRGLAMAQVRQACQLGFPGLMVDTADKQAGSLFDVLEMPALRDFLQCVREAGALAGLAGALRMQHLPAVLELGPDFAGFRSAVCTTDRGSALDPQRLRKLVQALR